MENLETQDTSAAKSQLPTRDELAAKFAHIKGWGVDIDPKNDPTYPIKNPRTDVEQLGYTWERPTQQPTTVEILHSNERPNVSAVFGTTSPPTGLSGAIRRYAFTHSESRLMHWIPLVVADRVNEIEGLIEDFSHGKVPNIFAEKGWKAEWKHNPKGLIQTVVISAVVTTALVALFSRDSKSSRKQLATR
ncbi:hypothetical protein [Spirosoma fluminis]